MLHMNESTSKQIEQLLIQYLYNYFLLLSLGIETRITKGC